MGLTDRRVGYVDAHGRYLPDAVSLVFVSHSCIMWARILKHSCPAAWKAWRKQNKQETKQWPMQAWKRS